MRTLFVIPQLDHSGAAKQLRLLAGNLPHGRFDRCLCVLGRDLIGTDALRKAGVRVESLGWKRWLDLNALARLRRLVREVRPELIHAWRPSALRAIGLVGAAGARLMVSALQPPLNRLDDWLLRRAERIIVGGPAHAERCRTGGMPAEKLIAIAPGVEIERHDPSDRDEIAGLDHQARCLLGIGPFHAHKGFRDAVWALDILRYLAKGLHLVLIGDGPDRPRLQQFIQDSQTGDCVHLVGTRENVSPWLNRAEVVWVPSRTLAGVNVALEAMAAGRPVVAANLPELAEIVHDGQTGFLVPAGDKMALARQTRLLLENAEQRRQFGDAGRERASRHFTLADLVRRHVDLYENSRG